MKITPKEYREVIKLALKEDVIFPDIDYNLEDETLSLMEPDKDVESIIASYLKGYRDDLAQSDSDLKSAKEKILALGLTEGEFSQLFKQ